MSWSYTAIGKPKAVLADAHDKLPKMKCPDPEQFMKTKFLDMIDAALSVMPANVAVRVSGSGSQWTQAEGTAINNLKCEIEPFYGFVE